jgi:hypothetical protein
MNMDIEDGLELIRTAYKAKGEERVWDRYLVDYGVRMDNEHFINFIDYLNDAYETKVEKEKVNNGNKTVEEILANAERIKNLDQKGGE